MMAELSLIALAFIVAFLAVKFYPEQTNRQFRRIVNARRVVVGVLGFLFALVFIRTGAFWLVLIGFIIILYMAIYLILEEPHKEMQQWSRG